MTSTNKVAGFVIAVVAGGLGLLAFFVLPFASTASYTSQFIASEAVQYIQLGGTASILSALVVLWLAPVLAGLIVLIAGVKLLSGSRMSGSKTAGGWLIALGILGVALYVGLLIYEYAQAASVSSQASINLSALGTGYWIYLVAMIGAIVGGAMGRSGAAQVGAAVPPPPVTYTQYQQPSSPQYPPYQQPSSPQYPPYQPPPQYPPPQRSSQGQQWPPNQ